MKLYRIQRTDRIGYDENAQHVIAAETEEEVVQLAKDEARDEGEATWSNATVELIGIYTGPKKEHHIIITDFNAG